MAGTHVPQLDERQGDRRQAADLVGREAEVDWIRACVATARADGGALLVTGEPGVGKTVRLDTASKAASAAGTRVLPAAGIQFEAGIELFRPEPARSPEENPMSHNAKVGQADAPNQVPPTVPQDYLAEVDLEYARWSEIVALVHVLMPDERLAPG